MCHFNIFESVGLFWLENHEKLNWYKRQGKSL